MDNQYINQDQDLLSIFECSGSEDNQTPSHDGGNYFSQHLCSFNGKNAKVIGKEDLGYSKERPDDFTPSPCLSSKGSGTHSTESSVGIESPHKRESRKRRGVWHEDDLEPKNPSFYYNDEYRLILNKEIQQVAFEANQDDLDVYPECQIGSSIWTAEEKALFFKALDILGKGNPRGISQRIGSKSELEVQNYLLTLHNNRSSRKKRTGLCNALDIPFAREISEKCCSLLEIAGDSLAVQQEYLEVNIEKKKWGTIWLITKDICQELSQGKLNPGNVKSVEIFKPIESLFNLKNWLQLSKRLFMNTAAYEEENWVNLSEPGEMPSIRATALEDFYSLTISITKRIVSATLFCTMSRLKAKSLGRSKDPEINCDDVKAAIRTLGLKCNSNEFWIGCARRCKLDVFKEIKPEAKPINNSGSKGKCLPDSSTKMTYDEVEKILKFYCQTGTCKPGEGFAINDSNPELIGDDRSEILVYEQRLDENNLDFETRASSPDNCSDNISEIISDPQDRTESHRIAQLEKLRLAQESQELYVDKFDIRASQEEEMMLWKILKQDPPFEISIAKTHIEPIPNFIHDVFEDKDWRNLLEYHSEWEGLDIQTSGHNLSLRREFSLKDAEQSRELDLVNENANANVDENRKGQDEIYDKQNSENYDSSSTCSDFTDHTMRNLRLLAANFQPSSDGTENDLM